MSAVYCPGVLPNPGDETLIDQRSAPHPNHSGWLRVLWTEPSQDPAWVYLTGLWPDGTPGHVMVWVDRLITRRTESERQIAQHWPDVFVADTLTARTLRRFLPPPDHHAHHVIVVASPDGELLRSVVAGLTGQPVTACRPTPRLTGRHLQVVHLLCQGLTNQQIADRLDLKPDTVKTHLFKARNLLGATSRTHMAVLAVRFGVVAESA